MALLESMIASDSLFGARKKRKKTLRATLKEVQREADKRGLRPGAKRGEFVVAGLMRRGIAIEDSRLVRLRKRRR